MGSLCGDFALWYPDVPRVPKVAMIGVRGRNNGRIRLASNAGDAHVQGAKESEELAVVR